MMMAKALLDRLNRGIESTLNAWCVVVEEGRQADLQLDGQTAWLSVAQPS
jgi:hypothetical protein